MSQVDKFRFETLETMSKLGSFSSSWPYFEKEIRAFLGVNPDAQKILELGGHLEKVFRSNVVPGRSNSAVSTGGTAWECLVAWYLNLVFVGTQVLVGRPSQKFTPSCISKALSIVIANHQTNTESDLIAFSVPRVKSKDSLNLAEINKAISLDTALCSVGVIQCKTNWNDNAQIPMLWDLIYQFSRNPIPRVNVGVDGYSPSSFRDFSYAFVTVPTVSTQFKASSLAVLRVTNLSGGNYWGKPTQNGVARRVSEYFTSNFASEFTGSVENSISSNLLADKTLLEKYLTLSWL